MDRDNQVLEALVELSVQLGVPFPAARQALFVSKLDSVPLFALLWAINYASENWEAQSMPQVGTLKKFASMAPPIPKALRSYNSQQIEEFSEQTREQAKAALKRLQDGLENWQDEPVEVLVRLVDAKTFAQAGQENVRRQMLQDQARALGVAA